jgi:hypothetical protein
LARFLKIRLDIIGGWIGDSTIFGQDGLHTTFCQFGGGL